MNLVFLRHGEATDNVKELISDKEIYWSTLTEDGINTVKESVKGLPDTVDKIYVSPLPRTIETARFVSELFPHTEVIIENRIREIYHGKYTHQKNNEDLDNTRIKQIGGDYFVRLGDYGENNLDIEGRLTSFLKDVHDSNLKDNTIVIVSHGSVTSYMKRILKIKTAHIQTGKMEIFNDVDFKPLYAHIRKLNKIKKEEVNRRVEVVNTLEVNPLLKKNLLTLAKKEVNNMEFSKEIFDKEMEGLKTSNLKQITNPKFKGDLILVCFYSDFSNFAKYWMDHYINIGIKNFVLVDNNSKDNSKEILESYQDKVNISFWEIKEKYNCYNMCGWKQQIFEHYGVDKTYLTVDSDELFIYKDYKNIRLEEYIKKNKLTSLKALMLDVYTNKNLYEGKIEDFKYVDKGTYKTSKCIYGERLFGGPRSRVFKINPSLQKMPLMKYTGKEYFANDHFYYPFSLNEKAKLSAYLLHYKFLPGDLDKYSEYASDGRHWNNSREYKIYSNTDNKISFYDKEISILVDDIDFDF